MKIITSLYMNSPNRTKISVNICKNKFSLKHQNYLKIILTLKIRFHLCSQMIKSLLWMRTKEVSLIIWNNRCNFVIKSRKISSMIIHISVKLKNHRMIISKNHVLCFVKIWYTKEWLQALKEVKIKKQMNQYSRVLLREKNRK